jgi:hypothetical protein
MGTTLKVIASPLVPFYVVPSSADPDSGVTSPVGSFATNIILASSQKGGIILQKERPVMVDWRDEDREVNFFKVRERYGMGLQELGRGIGVMKHVILKKNYDFALTSNVSLTNTSAYKFL